MMQQANIESTQESAPARSDVMAVRNIPTDQANVFSTGYFADIFDLVMSELRVRSRVDAAMWRISLPGDKVITMPMQGRKARSSTLFNQDAILNLAAGVKVRIDR